MANLQSNQKQEKQTNKGPYLGRHSRFTVIYTYIIICLLVSHGRAAWATPSLSWLTRSQNLRSRQTLPTPTLSSNRRIRSLRRPTSRFHTAPIQCRKPSLSFSRSTALVRAASAGATWPIPGAHSGGSTHLSTSSCAGGRCARRRDNRIDTSDRASLRDTTVVLVMKMCREMRSASEGRIGDASSGGSVARIWRRRNVCRMGATQRQRK